MFLGAHRRALVLALAPGALAAVLLASFFATSRVQELQRALEQRGQALTRQLARASQHATHGGELQLLQQLAAVAVGEPDVQRVTIYGGGGTVLLQVVTSQAGVDPSDARQLIFGHPVAGGRSAGDPVRSALQATPPAADSPQAPTLVQVALSPTATARRQRQVLISSLALTLSCLALGLAFGALLGRRLSSSPWSVEAPAANLTGDRPEELGSLVRGRDGVDRIPPPPRAQWRQQLEQTTAELRETLEELEIRNVELDLGRRKALEASRLKSEFLASVSHEIRTPMNAILGYIELLEQTSLERTQQAYLGTVRSSARSLLTLVNDILDLSKIEAGKAQLRAEPFQLRQTLEEGVILYSALAHAKGLRLSLDLAPELPAQAIGDAQRLSQILGNLVSNALKFTEQGEVEVSARSEPETAERMILVLSVRDTGIGIGPEDRERLFAAFSQVDSAVARKHPGTGLGLVISKRLATLMGGCIEVVSAPAQGSTFTLRAPLALDPHRQEQSPRAAGLVGETVLLLSADGTLARTVKHLLAPRGIDLVVVEQPDQLESRAQALPRSACQPLRVLLDAQGPAELLTAQRAALAALAQRLSIHLVLLGRPFGADGAASWPAGLQPHLRLQRPSRLVDLLASLSAGSGTEPAAGAAEDSTEGSCAAETTQVSSAPASIPGDARPWVLLADDNPVSRRLASLFLEQLGLLADQVSDGPAAVEACRHTCYKLVLMDVHMPSMDGIEAARQIRGLPGGYGAVPIVALTADAMRDDRERYLGAGMDDYLAKPFSRDSLAALIERWLPERMRR